MKKIFKKLTAIMAAVVISATASLSAGAVTTYNMSYNLHNTPGAPSSANVTQKKQSYSTNGLLSLNTITFVNDISFYKGGTVTVELSYYDRVTKTITSVSMTQTSTGRKTVTKNNLHIDPSKIVTVLAKISTSSTSYTAASGTVVIV